MSIRLSSMVGQSVTLDGTARNAHQGAVVVTDDEPVYIHGLQSWPLKLTNKQVRVTGKLLQRAIAPQATTGPGGEVSHGMDGDSYVVENAQWAAI
jgi:hypothetical protein